MIRNALRELEKDERDFKLGGLVPKKSAVPLIDFEVGQAEIEDQGDSMLCTCYATTKILELKDGVRRSPFYNALKAQEEGADIFQSGNDLRATCKTFLDYGSLPVSSAPPDIGSTNDWHNLSSKYDSLAENYAEQSFVSLD